MCKFFIVVALFTSFVLSAFSQTAVDPNDNVLLFYKLTDEQKTQFSTSDGLISNFWDVDWNDRDYIDKNTELNSFPGRDAWDGLDDARITIKAAGDPNGLYFCTRLRFCQTVEPFVS